MALRFDPPPGWPAPPEGWEPPEGWQPDPEWPAAPEGWTFWVEDEAAAGRAADPAPEPKPEQAPVVYWSDPTPSTTWAPQPPIDPNRWPAAAAPPELPRPIGNPLPYDGFQRIQWITLVAALAVPLGSVLPFVSYDDTAQPATWQVRPAALAVSFLFGVVLTGLVVLTRRGRLRTTACVSLLVLGLLGFAGYMIFTVVGLTSGISDQIGPRTVHWSPGLGIGLCIAGTAVVAFSSVLILRVPK